MAPAVLLQEEDMMTRRDILVGSMVIGGAALAQQTGKETGTLPGGDALVGKHAIQPLPFDPKKLSGLSEKLLVSHHDNNYAGAVKNLNKVEEALSKVGPDTPGFTVAGLEAAKLKFTNSMVLHEMYFGNLGGDGKAPAGAQIERVLVQAYGSRLRWEELFRALGMSLGGGSGWAILDWDFHAHGPRIYWAGDHTNAAAFCAPLLVMDMYEHAYTIDYGASAKDYIDAFFKNIQWAEVERRLGRAQKGDAALRG
ncbi:MAG TPA: Fe-Mn family superoxide dismutase [Myxococcales bacterium]|nr:Fe-Mn family superoxide dismutase [Myxococcales bacterium]